MQKFLFLIILLFPALARADVAVTHNIHYGQNAAQVVDVYRPDACRDTLCPVVLWVHGGGWKHGNMQRGPATKMMTTWAEQGIVMVGVNYRLSPAFKHPAHVEDVASAISWAHDNIADYGGDAARLSLLGHSAGAHLVALVATNPRFLAAHNLTPAGAIKNVFPIDTASFDLTQPSDFVKSMVDVAFGTDEAVLHDASPVWSVTENGSYPAFIMAANKVRQDAVDTCRALKRKLVAAGGSAEFLIVDHPGLRALEAHGQIAKDLQDMNADMTKRLIARVLQQ